jgi:serine/threonine protein kinase
MQPDDRPVLEEGHVLARRYEIRHELGRGSLSTVYAARDLRVPGAPTLYAVKEMADLGGLGREHPPLLTLFEREATLLAALHHPAIPRVYDYFLENNRVYLIMDCFDGQTLGSLLTQSTGPLSQSQVVSWAVQICNVLSYLHNHRPRPVIFRDLKPSHVLRTHDDQIVLIDFNVAMVFEPGRKDDMIGTVGYAAPEQYRGLAEPRSDVYGLGATMHHLLTQSDPRREPPFSFADRPLHDLNPRVSAGVEQAVMKALSYAPTDRFASALQMRDALLKATARDEVPPT